MLTLAPETVVTELANLVPGTLFYIHQEGNFRLAITLVPNGKHSVWLNLTGRPPFQLQTVERGDRSPTVLSLPYSPDAVRVRIDETSANAGIADHQPSRLLASVENGICISAVWPSLKDEPYRHVVPISVWEQTLVSDPRFAFDRWSLSVVDESGQWIDLVQRK